MPTRSAPRWLQLSGAAVQSEAVVADCATASGLGSVVDAISLRSVCAIVHAAGGDRIKAFSATSRADFDALIAINVAAPYFLTQALLARLQDGAAVVFVGSVSARRGLPMHALYGATKAALCGLTVNLASELAPRVRVNCVSPGATDTAMLEDFMRRSREGLSESEIKRQHVASSARQLLRRIAQPEEVARTIVHVALDATAMTGIDLAVDVGYTAS